MPWREIGVEEERLRFVILANRRGSGFSALCREFGISRPTGYKWLERYREEGAGEVLRERSRRPLGSPRQTVAVVEEAVVELRRQRPDWGARKLVREFQRQHPELACPSVATLHRILLRAGLVAAEDRHRAAVLRFERQEPNELWQMDFKGPQEGQFVGPLSVLDDHSRYLLALRQLPSTRREGVRDCLREVFEQAGLPDAMLMDHGTPWWNARGPWGWSDLTVWLMRQGIRMHFSGIGHPQTQGKIERMHRSLKAATRKRGAQLGEQAWLEEFRTEYNTLRPHEALDMEPPASRWRPSARAYQAQPREWEYPAGSLVVQLGERGQLHWRGRQWAVSYALKNQLVGVEEMGEGAVVYFCNTPLRHLDLRAGKAWPLPVDPFRPLPH